jgi:hypothetical protein
MQNALILPVLALSLIFSKSFSEATIDLIRNKEKAEVVIVIDRAYGFSA